MLTKALCLHLKCRSNSIWNVLNTVCFTFFLLLFYTLETVSLSAFASAELGQPFHSYPAGQIEWKQDSPQGEPRLAQSAPLKGHSGPRDRATRPLLAGVEEMENACVMLSLCVFEEMCCWFNQAFRPFFDWFRKHFLLGLLFCLFSYFCLRFFFFFLPGTHHTCRFLLLQQLLPTERKAVQIR